MKSKSQKVREYFRQHPLATPKEVGAKFKVAMPIVYKIRKEEQAMPVREESKPNEKADQQQVGGSHYKDMAVQPWAAMESWMTPEQFAGFLRGNAIKYLARCDAKGGLDDIKKARHYIDKLVEVRGNND
jgi:hypothetical protein